MIPRARPVVHHVITRLIAGGAQENTLLSCQALLDRFDVLLITGPPDRRRRRIPLPRGGLADRLRWGT